jgi:DNA modification methylase
MKKLILRHGDCVDVLKGYEDGSLGAIISDPPYGLFFMGKAFDDLGEGAAQREWHEAWLVEAYRVLRPGGVIKAFNGTRTFHHMAYAMAEAGFIDLRLEAWTYGSGFPKSYAIGQSIQKLLTTGKARRPDRDLKGRRTSIFAEGGYPDTGGKVELTETQAVGWDGWGTALKPSWEPVCVGRKP